MCFVSVCVCVCVRVCVCVCACVRACVCACDLTHCGGGCCRHGGELPVLVISNDGELYAELS